MFISDKNTDMSTTCFGSSIVLELEGAVQKEAESKVILSGST